MMFSIIQGSVFRVIDCESVHNRAVIILDFIRSTKHCNVTYRLNAFACRNIDVWNRLRSHVVNSDSVAVFKRRLTCVNLIKFCSHGTY